MTAYYNENDPKAAAWLRELIKANCIAPGDVDERSIEDVRPDDLQGYTQHHFFAGIGVWSHALRLSGWPDSREVWTGSCPCQPFSAAGKGKGIADERHLWPAWQYFIGQCRPETVFGEQVASKDGLGWFDLVQTDLEGSGYAVGANDICAAGVGAPHIRQRLWFVAERLADAERSRSQGRLSGRADPQRQDINGHAGCDGAIGGPWSNIDWIRCRDGKDRPVESGLEPLAASAAARMVRLRGYGNAINAEVARIFIESYMETTT